MEFNAEEILSSEYRFLYGESLEETTALYCYARRIGNLELEAVGLLLLAEQHLTTNTVSNSFELGIAYMHRAIELCRENGYINSLLSAKETLCSYLNSYGMLDEAHICCNEFLDIANTTSDSLRIAEGHMLLGRVLRDREEYIKSDSVLRKSRVFLQDDPASDRIGIFINLHLSVLASNQKEYEKALDLAMTALKQSERIIHQKEFIQALLGKQIALCRLELGNYNNEDMFDLIRRHAPEELWISAYYHDTRGHYFKTTGQIDSAITQYYKALDFYKDLDLNTEIINASSNLLHAMWMKDELSDEAYDVHKSVQEAADQLDGERKRITSFERAYYQLRDEKNRSESLEKKISNFNKILGLSAFAIALLLGIGILLYKQYHLKRRYNEELNGLNLELIKKNENLLSSKALIEEQNEKVQSELKTQLLLILGYGDQFKKLGRTFRDNKALDPSFKKRMLQMLDFKGNKEMVEDIDVKFQEVNELLISKLSHSYPNLTSNDLKLCLYLKMNLSTKEIAQLQQKTVESIKVARSRLRKKMGISDPYVKLTTYINSL